MTNKPAPAIDTNCINSIRFLGIDAVQKAKSGHPGIVMGAAPMSYVLWQRFLNVNPKNPSYFNRDRFVLSAGHGSMLQYGLMHLAGFEDVSIDEIKNFRQLGSKTPGHPENTHTAGVEVTTGPLGQGFANAVGLAIAEAHLTARFNKADHKLVDHYTYTIMGDGCHMEGVASEAASIAGHLGLGKLIALYDDNHISIDGSTDITFTEDVAARFEAYGWHVQVLDNGDDDLDAIEAAIKNARATTDKPSLIKIRTTIGYGSPKNAGQSSCHGAPLGDDEVAVTRKNLGWNHDPFEIPAEVYTQMGAICTRGAALETEWNQLFASYKKSYPADAKTFEQMISGELPDGWENALPTYKAGDKATATRSLSGQCLNSLAPVVPGLIGGSADLAGSNNCTLKESGFIKRGDFGHRNIHFGVREHAMAAICNGMALHGSGLVPFAATFLSFADYMRPSIRLSAISDAGVIYVMTHDSIGVGEDGPTHQPVEHIASLRAIPNLNVFRPADGTETAGAYRVAIAERSRPALLSLTRQGLPHLEGTDAAQVAKGAYALSDTDGKTPELILIGTGSEVALCENAAAELRQEGIAVRVVSMPCRELFETQSSDYQNQVLPPAVTKRMVVEAGVGFGWERYAGTDGDLLTIERFGLSAPGNQCFDHLGFTQENVVARAKALLGR